MIISPRETILSKFRENLWNYPEFFLARDGLFTTLISIYKLFQPFSHILLFLLIFLSIGLLNISKSFNLISAQKDIIVEGVIIGESGINRINPLLPTNTQIEVDLAGLIYEPLVRVNSDEKVEGILADSWKMVDESGKEYEFKLKENMFWHDGNKFNVDDVIATFTVLKALGNEEDKTVVSKHAELAQKMDIVKIDNDTVRFRLDEIVPTFYEDISVGILPKHILDEVSLSQFSWASFNLNPIGTGALEFIDYSENVVTLRTYVDYHSDKPEFEYLKINLYETGDEALAALKNGEIHMLVNPSTAILEDLSDWENLEVIESSALYRRYFALYFNLREEGGPEIFKDKNVRRAISLAVDRKKVLDKVGKTSKESLGPIPSNSWAYNKDALRFGFDVDKSKKTLSEAGWEEKEVEGKQVRMKDNNILRFEMSYLDKYDREIVAESIKEDLEKVGIVVKLDPRNSSDLNEALIATRNFESVLYGVEAPIDPDRIRLWHSDAVDYPGLNISSYIPEEQAAVIGTEKELERVSLIDVSLENGRSSLDRDKRNGTNGVSIGYQRFQEILLEDCPVVFLYHPVFNYVVHTRVEGIDLSDITSLEERYLSISKWNIK